MQLWTGQKAFLHAQASQPNIAFAASRGAGKTYALAAAMVIQAAANEGVYAILAPRWRTISGNVLLQMQKVGRDLGFSVTQGYYADRKCAWVENSPVAFLTTFTANSIAGFRGDSLRGAWMEEATMQTEDAFHAVESTLRDGDNPFLWLSYNRTTPTSWVKRLVEDGEEDDLGNRFQFELVEARTEDNQFLPASYLERLQRLPGHYRARDYENRWAAASGLIYPIWRECNCRFDARLPYILAYDPAPVNTQAAIAIQRHTDHFCAVDEIYTRRGATLRHGRAALEQIEARWGRPALAVLDPAAYDHVYEARFFRQWVTMKPLTKEHNATVPILRLLLEQGRLRVNPATCPNTAAELNSVIYDEDTEKIATKQEDHATDALRYVACYLEPERLVIAANQQNFQTDWDRHYVESTAGQLQAH